MSDVHQERSRQRRNALLKAAVELLVKQGMAAVTHRAVAERAGVPLASVRYYFRSREQLVLACLDAIDQRRSEEAQRSIEKARTLPPRAAAEIASLALRAYYGPDLDDFALCGTIGWVLDSARAGEPVSEKLATLRLVIDQELAALLQAGGFEGIPAELVMTVIDGSIVSAAAERRPRVAAQVEATVRQLLGGIFS